MKHIQDGIKPGPIIDFIVAGQNLMTTLSTLLINSILVVGMFFYQLFTLQPAFVVDRVPSILLSYSVVFHACSFDTLKLLISFQNYFLEKLINMIGS